MTILAIIPARGGSKGLPGKNKRMFRGAPLIVHAIRAARAASCITDVWVSTDDAELADIARRAGAEVPALRPAAYATDEAHVSLAILHSIDLYKARHGTDPEAIAILPPTAPLRTSADIEAACRLWQDSGAASCISFAPLGKPLHWLFKRHTNDPARMEQLHQASLEKRRQDSDDVYVPNGAIYLSRSASYRAHLTCYVDDMVAYIMPRERSVDIDTELDFQLAEQSLNLCESRTATDKAHD
jgi:CMP-N,N'-diacetyllegionaminic acid synthase